MNPIKQESEFCIHRNENTGRKVVQVEHWISLSRRLPDCFNCAVQLQFVLHVQLVFP